MVIEAYKRYDGQALGSEKVGECSGEGGEKIGNILAPPKTFHKNVYSPKPNPLENKLDTTPDSPIFPHPTNDFQKLMKFVSTKESELGEKKSDKPSREKPSEQPHPKPSPKLIRFHCYYCGRDGHNGEFCFKRKHEKRMAKEWANKDKYHPSNGVFEPRMQMPKANAIVRTIPAWGDRKVASGAAGQAPPVRPVLVWTDSGLVFVLVRMLCLVLVVGMESLQVVTLLDILHLVPNTRVRGGTVHSLPFVAFVLLQVERVGVTPRVFAHCQIVLRTHLLITSINHLDDHRSTLGQNPSSTPLFFP
jgi:hypothetical protein